MNILSVYYLYSYSYSYYYQNLFTASSILPTAIPSPTRAPTFTSTFTPTPTPTSTPTPIPKSGFVPTYKYEDYLKPLNNVTNNPSASPTSIPTTSPSLFYNMNTSNESDTNQKSASVRILPSLIHSIWSLTLIIFI